MVNLYVLEVRFKNKELIKLYETGKSAKLRLPSNVVDKFFATIQKIEAANTIQDLLSDKGLRFKKLKGRGEEYSMRLNDKYRLEMEIKWSDNKLSVGVFILLDISNHYGD